MTNPVLRFLHRQTWQRIPRPWRRRTLAAVTTRLAPRPTPDTAAALPIIVVGFLTATTGLGMSARLCYRALQAAGMPVMGIDLSQAFRQDETVEAFDFDDGREHRGPGTLIFHINAPFMPLALFHLGRRVIAGKHCVGYWAWELPRAPAEWRAGFDGVHRVLVPSTFTKDALTRFGAPSPIDVLAHPVAVTALDQSPKHNTKRSAFVVVTVFNAASGFTRKNPLGAVSAFVQAFDKDPDAHLIVKAQNLDVYPAGAAQLRALTSSHDNITLDERILCEKSLADLYREADVLLSLHRSEGFGLVLAEAMLQGTPVIATDWSGNQDFLNVQNG